MVEAYRELARSREALGEARRVSAGNGTGTDAGRIGPLEDAARAAADRLEACAAGLAELGVQVKDQLKDVFGLSITTDGWTSVATCGYYTVTAH